MITAPTPALLKGKTGNWELVIGLEVHAQVTSNSKLFSGAATDFGSEPNSQVSLVDAAFPGMLPVINKYCVEQAVRTGLGIEAEINLRSVFDRKNYFYPDLPAGYQISQYKQPIVGEGMVHVDLPDGSVRSVGIERLHLEQDAGKSLHDQHPKNTYVDLNRSGIALMEIVSKPDMRSGEEAGAYVRKLRTILRYLGTCDGNMEQGSLRCDVNVSVRKPGDKLGTRCEIKNVNSVRYLQQAVDYESRRQIEELEAGRPIKQETRLYDANTGTTRSMRSKEEAHDYRYFPDPDLLPLQLTADYVARIKATLPELPDARRARLESELRIAPYQARVLVAEKESADYFEAFVAAVAKRTGKPLQDIGQDCANVVVTELFGILNKEGKPIEASPISADALAGLQALKMNGTISGPTAKKVFDEMFATGKDAAAIVEEKGLKQVSDTGALEALVDKVIAENPKQVEQFRGGKETVITFFVGQIMKLSRGTANPGLVNELLKKKLQG
ncbi:MAG: Asp-tRNA(Asn)/Glu-tRNA(Gln) amidotransferase subunit GatB [Alphaproteobacteria bacterium]|nr:Asp-tRNA(Asn)/Glu-tRNA(Gln) amidotransferase subunit GatB [Alphaproteobacteria bacterium]